VTKVLLTAIRLSAPVVLCLLFCALADGKDAVETPANKPAEALYLQLGQVGLDSARVYQVRDASLDRSAIHISLEDGTIAFTQDVLGRITGAFFEGDGEVLLAPPNHIERQSMTLFTGMAILEEHFESAYFRFNDDVYSQLLPGLRAAENKQEFVDQYEMTARNLAAADAMRLLLSFSNLLPVKDASPSSKKVTVAIPNVDRYLHARLQGTKLGVFDVSFDSLAQEQIQAGQARTAEDGVTYYDVWTSFSPAGPEQSTDAEKQKRRDSEKEPSRHDWFRIRHYAITTEVQPPKQIHAQADLQIEVNNDGVRALLFELSRFLQIQSVKLDGHKVEFIHNPSVEGTQLSRRGNDTVAVILPVPARAGQKLDLQFVYGGEVLDEAGRGLLYVGARGTWYPNRGMEMADYDLQFKYPPDWTLVATGRPTSVPPLSSPGQPSVMQVSRWVSDRPIPVAGFNLGKYKEASTQAGSVTVDTYATFDVERSFPTPPVQRLGAAPAAPTSPFIPPPPELIIPRRPSPAQNEVSVGESAAQAIRYFSERFGPYPYSRLALTQMPGNESQGWPGLVFLSSYAFLSAPDREQLHLEPYEVSLQQSVPAHETAHQWWGDLITWSTYRDQWFTEGLANYCALMMLEDNNPSAFRQVMEKYRRDLVQKNKDGMAPMDAGPVTLGVRLLSSRFPQGYEAISYGRATWLFYMLRTMLDDAEAQEHGGKVPTGADEPFVRGLRRFRQEYEGKSITTAELLDVFSEELPPSLYYEGKRSLDWFLDGWVNGTALPRLELKTVHISQKGAGRLVTGTILQKEAPQELVTSVPIYAVVAGRTPRLLGRVFADGPESTFQISAPVGTRKVLLDPYQTILTSPK
jgi:hypothetical protein